MLTGCSARCDARSARRSRPAECTRCLSWTSARTTVTARAAALRCCAARSRAGRRGGAHESKPSNVTKLVALAAESPLPASLTDEHAIAPNLAAEPVPQRLGIGVEIENGAKDQQPIWQVNFGPR